ncbi:polysaccharide biosynthesis C-terminal domain-containing protein [Lacinutrix neustonica]|uniref:Polysaccharide biosynthesis C-terminal domain-containing protein n=1 Tax=Lacinutrix neustonica TaxID=2980107 RepID=A0A9E8MX79_9FLAO|nr:polysaccharide biosynthesis C-terminal domain-containing protein [Lacinutrix neustonica]WAC02575.1 polysaccharide biosynthesis C-terminal domain-containing protein [Lacinutrix neustonica]
MGIVIKQSIQNTVTTYIGFVIGAINTLFLYTHFLTKEYFGLVGFVLSTANIMMPLFMFGVSNTLVKFYTSYKTKNQQNGFLTLMLFLPLLMIISVGLFGTLGYEWISNWLARKNSIIKDYTWLIYVIAVAMAYFEIFFAWSKIHFKSAFGNIMKEVFHRVCVMILLISVYLKWLTVSQFVYSLGGVYVLRMLIMTIYAFSIRFPKVNFNFNFNVGSVLKYSFLIIIAGSVAMLMLDLDKSMLGLLVQIDNIASYNVAIFIVTVIAVPSRAMHQITYPLTAKLMNEKNFKDLSNLYKKSALNLLVVAGLLFILIIANIKELYTILPQDYSQGLYVVIITAIIKLLDNLSGNNNSIIFNSDYYRIILFFGLLIIMVAIVLNFIFIPKYNINGAATASFFALSLYGILKVWYVNKKFKMHPFSKKTGPTLLLIVCISLLFYFWDFNFDPIINIVFKSLIISIIYGVLVLRLKLSNDISDIISRIITHRINK